MLEAHDPITVQHPNWGRPKWAALFFYTAPAEEAVSQFVIPAKPREAGRVPGSRSA
jgi:hypothetical protein